MLNSYKQKQKDNLKDSVVQKKCYTAMSCQDFYFDLTNFSFAASSSTIFSQHVQQSPIIATQWICQIIVSVRYKNTKTIAHIWMFIVSESVDECKSKCFRSALNFNSP